MGLFNLFRKGMKNTRDFITAGFDRIAASVGIFDEDMLDELEMLLVQSDVGIAASGMILKEIRTSIRNSGNSSRESVLRTMENCMLSILGKPGRLKIQEEKLNILLMVGVNGTGKTTTAGKLCARFKREGKKVLLGAADTFRAAAIEQLSHWGERTHTPVVAHQEGADPAAVVYDAIHAAKARHADILILDTAGRLHNKQNLMDELGKIRRIIAREASDAHVETLLVMDATTGQNAVTQAKVFSEVSDVTGLVMTKLDGNAKGGVAIAVAYEVKTPFMLAGLGEGLDDLIDFDALSFVRSLLPDHPALVDQNDPVM